MASIERRQTTKGNRYDVRHRGPGGEHRKQTFRTRKDAERFVHNVESEKLKGNWLDPALGKVTFGEWAVQWLDEGQRAKRAATLARDRNVIETHLVPAFGAQPLMSITRRDVQALVDRWNVSLASKSVRTYFGVLRAILNAAVDAEHLGRSPCRGIKQPALERKRQIQFLTVDELRRLADATCDEYRPMIYLAGVLGLRLAEVLGLRVGRVDLLRRSIEVSETLAEVEGFLLREDVKTSSSRRTLDLPPFLVEVLAEHLAARGLTGADPDALVFVDSDGGPLRASNFRHRVWNPARTAAGFDGLTFHHLRHTAVGFLIDAGAHVAVMQQRIGHSSSRTTLDLYGHVLRSTDQTATDHLEGLFTPPLGLVAELE